MNKTDLTTGILTNLYFTSQKDAKGPRTEVADHQLNFGCCPGDMKPTIYHIILWHREKGNTEDRIFDRLWVTVNSPDTQTRFNQWHTLNIANMAWTLTLPPPFASIDISGKLVSPDPNVWKAPKKKPTYLHHDAVYEMRSRQVTGDYGHQATYDKDGILITKTIAAGTADFVSTVNSLGMTVASWGHLTKDVEPFIRALQLDGNPCLRNDFLAPTDLNRPCLHQGVYLNQYLGCRPVVPTGTRPRP